MAKKKYWHHGFHVMYSVSKEVAEKYPGHYIVRWLPDQPFVVVREYPERNMVRCQFIHSEQTIYFQINYLIKTEL
jgi:hypothetical protein